MTVKELKEHLATCDDKARVVYYNSNDKMSEVDSVTVEVLTEYDMDYVYEDSTLKEGETVALLI